MIGSSLQCRAMVSLVPAVPGPGRNGMRAARRYVFASEAAAAESEDGRSSNFVVARDDAAALEQARARCAHFALCL